MSAKYGKDFFPDPLHSPSIIIPWLGFYLYISLILLKRTLIEGTTGYDCINMQPSDFSETQINYIYLKEFTGLKLCITFPLLISVLPSWYNFAL